MSIPVDNTHKTNAIAAGDIGTLLDLIAPDCVWRVGGQSPVAGTYTDTTGSSALRPAARLSGGHPGPSWSTWPSCPRSG